jgi:hypothetical protein
LSVPGLGGESSGVRVGKGEDPTPDTKAITARKADVLFNVFFVGNMINDKGNTSSFPDMTNYPGGCCLFRDPQKGDSAANTFGEVLAHEAGHALGEPDDYADKNSLTYWTVRTDSLIDPSMAQCMWKSIENFPP